MKHLRIVLSACIALCVAQNAAVGQDFRKVVEIVGDMESTLKKMIKTEESQRKTEIASLKSDLAALRTSMATSAAPPSVQPVGSASFAVDGLAPRVEVLEKRVAELQPSGNIAILSSQLSTLIAELKKTIDDTKLAQVGQQKPGQPGPSPATTDTKPPGPPAAPGPSVKVGMLAQVQGQALEEQISAAQDAAGSTPHLQRQMYIRRLRVLVGGNITGNATYFFESDATNIGKVAANGAKTTGVSMYVQDAYVQYVFTPEIGVIAGLQLVGTSRNSLQSAATLMALNYGTYQFITSSPLDNSVGRDLGINLRGFLADERLEYRFGAFSGKNINLYSPFRVTARVQYDFKEREKGFFYTGTTLGKGEILAVGAGLDMQGSFRGYGFDAMVDLPAGSLGSLTASLSWTSYNGGGTNEDSTYFTALIPRQFVFFSEVGYYFKDLGLQPYLKYESNQVKATVLKQVGATLATLDLQNELRSGKRLGMGLNYYVSGHSVNFKALYELVWRNRLSQTAGIAEGAKNGEFTVQIQFFNF